MPYPLYTQIYAIPFENKNKLMIEYYDKKPHDRNVGITQSQIESDQVPLDFFSTPMSHGNYMDFSLTGQLYVFFADSKVGLPLIC